MNIELHIVFVENLIASAAGNGVVILWDLNKVNESKQGNNYHLFLFKDAGEQSV